MEKQTIKSSLLFWSKHVWKWAPKPSVLTLMSDGSMTLVDNKGIVFTAQTSDLTEVYYGSFGGLSLTFKDGRKFRFQTNPTSYSSRPNEKLKQVLNNPTAVANAANSQYTQIFTAAGAQVPNPAGVALAGIAIADEFAAAVKMLDWTEAFSKFTKVTKSKRNGMFIMLIVSIPVIIFFIALPFIFGALFSK